MKKRNAPTTQAGRSGADDPNRVEKPKVPHASQHVQRTCSPARKRIAREVRYLDLGQVVNSTRYQFHAPPAAEVRKALDQDIMANGVREPITMDETFEVIGGHTRVEILHEQMAQGRDHGKVPCVVVTGMTDDEKCIEAVALNGLRRTETRAQKSETARRFLHRCPNLSDEQIAQLTGVTRWSISRYREEMEAAGDIPAVTAFACKDGKVRRRRAKATAKTLPGSVPKPVAEDRDENKQAPATSYAKVASDPTPTGSAKEPQEPDIVGTGVADPVPFVFLDCVQAQDLSCLSGYFRSLSHAVTADGLVAVSIRQDQQPDVFSAAAGSSDWVFLGTCAPSVPAPRKTGCAFACRFTPVLLFAKTGGPTWETVTLKIEGVAVGDAPLGVALARACVPEAQDCLVVAVTPTGTRQEVVELRPRPEPPRAFTESEYERMTLFGGDPVRATTYAAAAFRAVLDSLRSREQAPKEPQSWSCRGQIFRFEVDPIVDAHGGIYGRVLGRYGSDGTALIHPDGEVIRFPTASDSIIEKATLMAAAISRMGAPE